MATAFQQRGPPHRSCLNIHSQCFSDHRCIVSGSAYACILELSFDRPSHLLAFVIRQGSDLQGFMGSPQATRCPPYILSLLPGLVSHASRSLNGQDSHQGMGVYALAELVPQHRRICMHQRDPE